MIAGSTVKNLLKIEVESAVWILEKLCAEAGQSIERSAIRRAVDQAAEVWPLEAADFWWRWVVEASRSLGFRYKVVDGTFYELKSLLKEQALLVTRSIDDDSWIAITKLQRGRFQVFQLDSDRTRRWDSQAHLKRNLGLHTKDQVLRTVVFEPQLMAAMDLRTDSHAKSPLSRLFALLRPERGDIALTLVFALVTGLLALATPMAVETLVNTVAFGRVVQPVIVLSMMLFAFLTFSAALKLLQTIVVEIIQRRLFARVAADLAYRLPRVELKALDGQSGRELVNRFFDVVTIQKVTAQLLLDGISLILGTLIGMSVLAFYHPWLLGFDVILLALITFVILVLGRGAIYTSIKESKTKYLMTAWLENLMSCPLAFRHGDAAEFALERSDRHIHDYLTARKNHFRILLRQIIFALGVQAIASTALLGLGGWLVMQGQLTLGQLVAAELIVTVIVGSFAKLGKHVESFYDLMAAVDKLGGLFDLPIEPQDGLLFFSTNEPAKVKLTNLTLSGANGIHLVKHLNFEIAAGDRVVVQGRSGSGKSNLLDLLFGTRSADAGYLSINEIDPRDLRPDALRRFVALIRDIEIFDGTIAENIHLERPEISPQDVREALSKLGMLDDVLTLPQGLDTLVVETGYPLSKNQMKKLMIARAIAGAPTLLLVDTLLDGLPDEDVDQIADKLFSPLEPWTLIMVTGRKRLLQRGNKQLDLDHVQECEEESPDA